MTGTEDAAEPEATALLDAAEPEALAETHEDGELDGLLSGDLPQANGVRRSPARVVYVCVDVSGRELTKPEREFLTEFGDLLLRRKMWFGGAGIGGSPWLTTRAGGFLERLHLRTEPPDARGSFAWVECRLAKKTRTKRGKP